jgi:hypothetical protein
MDSTLLAAIIAFISSIVIYLYQKWDSRVTLNRALLTEIARMLSVLDSHYRYWLDALKTDASDQPLIPFFIDVYEKTAGNMGDLDREYAMVIVEFYGFIRYLNNLQEARDNFTDSDEFNKRYTETLAKVLSRYSEKFNRAFFKYNVAKPIFGDLNKK